MPFFKDVINFDLFHTYPTRLPFLFICFDFNIVVCECQQAHAARNGRK